MFSISNLACVRRDHHLFSGLGFWLESGGRLHIAGENGVDKLGDRYRRAVLYLGHHDALITALE
jgi:ABC-type transport system involved in cytochrome c biogenesis ATPase subunit